MGEQGLKTSSGGWVKVVNFRPQDKTQILCLINHLSSASLLCLLGLSFSNNHTHPHPYQISASGKKSYNKKRGRPEGDNHRSQLKNDFLLPAEWWFVLKVFSWGAFWVDLIGTVCNFGAVYYLFHGKEVFLVCNLEIDENPSTFTSSLWAATVVETWIWVVYLTQT